jgi:hypothetical protein
MAPAKSFISLFLSASLVAASCQEAAAAARAVLAPSSRAPAVTAIAPGAALLLPRTAVSNPALAPSLGLQTGLPVIAPLAVSPAPAGETAKAAAIETPRTLTVQTAPLKARAASKTRSVSAQTVNRAEASNSPTLTLKRLAASEGKSREEAPASHAALSSRWSARFDGAPKLADSSPVLANAPGSTARSLPALKRAGLREGAPRLVNAADKAPKPAAKSAPKKKTLWTRVKENRFLLSAVAGTALGLAGVNLGTLPGLSLSPGLFFGVLPWLAAPFIGLNIFSSFSKTSIIKESKTLFSFLVITVAGLAISAGVTAVMTGLLPVVDPASFAAAEIPGISSGGFSPMQFMLPIIGFFTLASVLYKRARSVNAGAESKEFPPGWKGAVMRVFDRLGRLFVNSRTAPALEKAGDYGEKGATLINKLFPLFINIIGLPAVATLLSMTMATGGLDLILSFSGYYLTAFTGMTVGFLAMLAAFFLIGARGKDFGELMKVAITGFSLSSSSATMPTEKEALKAIGVSRRVRNSVVPLGGVFNMFGSSLYMGLTAFYALSMFGAAPTVAQYFNTALAVIAIAMGAPGIPASNITLLDPVLRQTGLQSGNIGKVYTMILPGDRILDMAQTALNVMGDMLPAALQDRNRLRYRRAKRLREAWERAKREKKTP